MSLKAWRDVIAPHPDVARGQYKQSEFAADLGQVVNGEGSSEYTQPVEFFSRTYFTKGLKNLLVKTLRRLSFNEGEPVIQLKTSFGGGKTHSLLALYHLFGGKISAEQSSAVREILQAAQAESLPPVKTAVVVGTWKNPLKSTLWGEIAAQLANSTGKSELYELIRENDEKKISPGVDTLKEIFNAASPCLILIDEIVAYGRKLEGGAIDGGTFGNFLSFIQELTEAAKASKNVAVVVSIPESDAEVGDELGRRVLAKVERYFGRVELIWESATPVEGYEIVRRRLFKACNDNQAREEICSAFFGMYVSNAKDFPYESRQPSYRERLLACYPIHPKLFDYFYEKWTSLENFQSTRGVLRLMANVIYCLWSKNDQSALIMPGNMPLDFEPVREELAKFFQGNWSAIINAEVDGDKSKPYELDKGSDRFGRLSAARKVTRTIFMGTAPSSRFNDVRGIEENEIRLGVIQPQDLESVAVFNDAITKLKENLYYLYSKDKRLWFGVTPTLRKLVDEKREQFPDDAIDYAIEERLKKWKVRNSFCGVHLCPNNSSDVIDEQTARLVILAPKYAYDEKQEEDAARGFAKNILENRGTTPRKYRNMLLFLAADADKLTILKRAVREYKAWKEILAEKQIHNLDSLQITDAKSNLESAEKTFAIKVSQAYCRIFAPAQSSGADTKNLQWDMKEIACTAEENISAAAEKVTSNEMLLKGLGREQLKRLLDEFIWRERDAVKLNQLWEYFTTFYYLPRLNDKEVLLETVRKGVENKTFALAENENLDELKFGDISLREISLENFLVKAVVAQKQLDAKTKNDTPEEKEEQPAQENSETDSPPTPEIKLSKNFSMQVKLDETRLNRSFNNCSEEIISHLADLPKAEVSISLSVNIVVPDGIQKDLEETIADNCRNLKIKDFSFE